MEDEAWIRDDTSFDMKQMKYSDEKAGRVRLGLGKNAMEKRCEGATTETRRRMGRTLASKVEISS